MSDFPAVGTLWRTPHGTVVEVVGHDRSTVHVRYVSGPKRDNWDNPERFRYAAFRRMFEQVTLESVG